MTEIKLSKAETKILTDAAGQDGRITLPDSMKPAAQQRLIGRLLRDRLAIAEGDEHRLTPAGYEAVGLEPPRAAGSKKELVVELLRREEGASLAELVAATGWLPHTTRAVLSRLRSAGQELAKSARPDGATAYRLKAEQPALEEKPQRAGRAKAGEETRAAA